MPAVKKKARVRMCRCLDKIRGRKELEDANTKILGMIIFGRRGSIEVPQIEVAKLDTKLRVKPRPVVPAYCPFCGSKYPDCE